MTTQYLRFSALTLFVSLATSAALSAPALAAQRTPAKTIIRESQALARQCAFKPIRIDTFGRKVQAPLLSRCPELLVAPREARFAISDGLVVAVLKDSAHSDGGDFNDLRFYDRKGRLLAEVPSVLAFGDILVALSGTHPSAD
jgi:hypothetical protein